MVLNTGSYFVYQSCDPEEQCNHPSNNDCKISSTSSDDGVIPERKFDGNKLIQREHDKSVDYVDD